jgi:hypothetical protein
MASTTPIFLVACHRSGTTLLRYLLDTHPAIACPPESKFIAGLRSFFEYPQAQKGLHSLGVPRAALLADIRIMIEGVFRQYADGRKKRRWMDKTPNYYTCLDFIDEVFEGNVQYLFMVRHPLDCIHSIDGYFLNASTEHEDPEITRQVRQYGKGRTAWAHYWVEVYEKILAFEHDKPHRRMLIRYETLATEPDATLREICAFIGEEYDPNILTTAFETQHDGGYEDDHIQATNRVHTDRIGAWKAWPREEAERLWSIVGPLAVRLDYSL